MNQTGTVGREVGGWRRGAGALVVLLALGAGNGRDAKDDGSGSVPAKVGQWRFNQAAADKLDILLMIDNSTGMAPFQTKLAQRLPDMLDIIQGLQNGPLSLHIGTISSSLGAGINGDVPGCTPGKPGNDNGAFQHPSACALNTGETYLVSGNGAANFTGAIGDVAGCLVGLGEMGCRFDHAFASTEVALMRSGNLSDLDNGGFLRPDAYLMVILLTSEDDCSVPGASDLFDPKQTQLSDPFGGLQSYRCNEFGHLCDGQPPPHNPPAAPTTLNNCESNENGKLIRVAEFVNYLKSLKADPAMTFLTVLAGSPTPYRIGAKEQPLPSGGTELQPEIQHSCLGSAGEFADPAVRLAQAVEGFGANAVFEDICANDYRPALQQIATVIGRSMGGSCIDDQIVPTPAGTPDCVVAERSYTMTGAPIDTPLPACDATRSVIPCWELDQTGLCLPGAQFRVCRDVACDPAVRPTDERQALVTCTLAP